MTKKLKELMKVLQDEELSYNKEGKEKFKKLSKEFLKELGESLGFTEMEIRFNAGGIAVSGEGILYGMWNNNNGVCVYISQYSNRNKPFMYRTIKGMKDYTGGQNNWLNHYELDDYNYLVNKIKRLKK